MNSHKHTETQKHIRQGSDLTVINLLRLIPLYKARFRADIAVCLYTGVSEMEGNNT